MSPMINASFPGLQDVPVRYDARTGKKSSDTTFVKPGSAEGVVQSSQTGPQGTAEAAATGQAPGNQQATPAYTVKITPEASEASKVTPVNEYPREAESKPAKGTAEQRQSQSGQELTQEEQKEVQDLKKQDQQVRQHEQAHQAAGGRYTRGGAQYSFTNGPDGRRYASGGEVSIDMSAEEAPEATVAKMNTVRRAALAPMDPSPTDRAVAARATQKAASARQEQAKERMEEAAEESSPGRADMKTGTASSISPSGMPADPSPVSNSSNVSDGFTATLKQSVNNAYTHSVSKPESVQSHPTFRAMA